LHRLDKVKISLRSQNQLGQLKSKTGLPINVLARFGICMSLADKSLPNPDMYNERGMELLPHVLFGKNEMVYATMFKQRLHNDGLDYEKYAKRMIRAHVNRGAGMLFPRIDGLEDFANLLEAHAT